ncbi:MAG: AEC family transporter [Oscillospiraceae bacterium]
MSKIIFNQAIIMFILIALGAFCYKIKLINNDGNKQLTNLLLYIVNPVIVFNSYLMEFKQELAVNLFYAFILAVATHIIAMLISYIFIRNKKDDNGKTAIERFSVIYTNCGFMGIPLLTALFGQEGVFYASAYLTVFNLLSWSHGYAMISGTKDKKTILKGICSPVVFAVILGLIFFFVQIPVPYIIKESVKHISSLNTPIAMIVLGVNLAQYNLLETFKKPRIYYVCLMGSLFVPTVLCFIYSLFPIPKTVILSNIIQAACPCATVTLLFSTKLNKNVEHATSVVTMSNIISIITIPIITIVFDIFQKMF